MFITCNICEARNEQLASQRSLSTFYSIQFTFCPNGVHFNMAELQKGKAFFSTALRDITFCSSAPSKF